MTQKTNKKIDEKILISPCSELLIDKKSLNLFRKSFRENFSEYRHSQIYNLFSNSIIPSGGENFLPLFNESLSTFFSYCSNYHIILNSDFQNLLDMRIENINDFFNARKEGGENFHLPPEKLYLNNKNIENNFNDFPIVKLHEYNLDKEINFKINKLPNLSSIRKEIDFKFIHRFFEINYNKHIIICCRSRGSLERIKKILTVFSEGLRCLKLLLKKSSTSRCVGLVGWAGKVIFRNVTNLHGVVFVGAGAESYLQKADVFHFVER